MDIQAAEDYIVVLMKKHQLRHELTTFDSGCKMIDIWFDDSFYVVQLEPDFLGLSLINDDNPGFDTVPDERFDNFDAFKERCQEVFAKRR